MCALLGAVLVVQSDSRRKEGHVVSVIYYLYGQNQRHFHHNLVQENSPQGRERSDCQPKFPGGRTPKPPVFQLTLEYSNLFITLSNLMMVFNMTSVMSQM